MPSALQVDPHQERSDAQVSQPPEHQSLTRSTTRDVFEVFAGLPAIPDARFWLHGLSPFRRRGIGKVAMFLTFQDVSFAYDGSCEPVISRASFTLRPGWTGVLGANGAGKTTLLRLAIGTLTPIYGRIDFSGIGLHCEQRTDVEPAGLQALLSAEDSRAQRLIQLLGLGTDWADRWRTLSHGERKRAQLAMVMHGDPDLLAVDEPTNHLDRETREIVQRALSSFSGIGLLVSHDRDLLDELCGQCLCLEPPGIKLRPGGYTRGVRQMELERTANARERAWAAQEAAHLRREIHARREQAAKAERQRSKRGLAKHDSDARAKVNAARVADHGSGSRIRQLEGRFQQSLDRKQRIVVQREHSMGITLAGQRSPRPRLLWLPEGEISLGQGRALRIPSLVIGPDDRIGVTGPNGSGKSTLLRHILQAMDPAPGMAAHIPQEIDASGSREILGTFKALPSSGLGKAMTIVRRLGSDPIRLLQSAEPSPGELRKLLLASHIGADPCLFILDEPTNHLDLPSIECLEEALRGCRAALLLVSHDQRFLSALTRRSWDIRPMAGAFGRWELTDSALSLEDPLQGK